MMEININEKNSGQQSFFFEPIAMKEIQTNDVKEILTKWGLFDTLKIASFRFNQHYQDYDSTRFLQDLFSNPNVKYILQNLQIGNEPINEIKYHKLRCTELSMELFKELDEQKIVAGGYIAKTYPDFFQGIQICDKLRQVLIMEQSQGYCIFDESQRNELLFKIFQFLVLGGSLNQYQDKIEPYLEWTKKIYKSLVTVRKRQQTNQMYIESFCYNIQKIGSCFSRDLNPQNFIYVIVNPSIRTVNIIANKWVKFW